MSDDPIDRAVARQVFFNRLTELAFKPNAETIATLALRGDVAVVVFEPDDLGRSAATALGWDGLSRVFALPADARSKLAKSDHVTAAWLARPPSDTARLFVIAQSGTLLVNYTPGRGFYLEPNSTDAHTLS